MCKDEKPSLPFLCYLSNVDPVYCFAGERTSAQKSYDQR